MKGLKITQGIKVETETVAVEGFIEVYVRKRKIL